VPDSECGIVRERLRIRARGAVIALARGIDALLADQSQALVAATDAALPRLRLSGLRAMYTAAGEPSGDRESSLPAGGGRDRASGRERGHPVVLMTSSATDVAGSA
jgi:hypothetical protein